MPLPPITPMQTPASAVAPRPFFGVTIVRSAFVLAMFGWGLGFYGPPVYLHAVVQRTGWPLDAVSFAVTWHFLCGAALVSQLARLHRRFGLATTTLLGAVSLACGVSAWSLADTPGTLFLAATLTGAGWATLGAAAINAIVAPWYGRGRPLALAKAYNGASVGGMVFPPVLVALAAASGATGAALLIAMVTILVVGILAAQVLPLTPARLGQHADGMPHAAPVQPDADLPPSPAGRLWRDRRFQTLAAAMALGLFAQVGMLAHLFGLLAASIGEHGAAAAMTLATTCAIAGRTLVGRLLPPTADRRAVAAASYATQLLASLLLMTTGTDNLPVTLGGVVLLGLGIGNATSLPPLVAQAEFRAADVQRVVPWIVAISQALFAFAPAVFAPLLSMAQEPAGGRDGTAFFAGVAVVQALAITCMWLGRRAPTAR